ncbi:MAG: hypothetical protein GXO98_06655 [Nitrospirae bacterium]|nr:hypothetical protein [Nitrospirota bacterium]
MKSTTALSLGMRLVALVLGVRAIVYLPTFGWTLRRLADEPKQLPFAVSMGMAIALSLAAAWLLFRFADRLATRFISSDDEIGLKGYDDPSVRREVFQLALRIIGAVCIAFSIPQFVGQGIVRIVTYSSFQMQLWLHLVPGIISFCIGVYFLKGGELLVRIAYGREHAPNERTGT